MSRISSGVGLFSGLDYATLVDQLIAIDARPRDQILVRMRNIDAQRAAFMDISARLTALLSRVETMTKPSLFNAVKATSSNPDVLGATAGETAQPGAHSFIVRALATTQQAVSRGFTTRDAALSAGTLTVESAKARVNRQTALEELNGFTGVQRGSFKLTDGKGKEAVINIREAQTVGDVVDLINAADVDIRAELRGESLALVDTSGGNNGIRVREQGDTHTAADLGFGSNNNTGGPELVGTKVFYLADTTPMAALNDGLGVRRAVAGGDFTIQSTNAAVNVTVDLSDILKDTTKLGRLNHGQGVDLGTIRITTRDGKATEVDLSQAQTIGDVKKTIEEKVKKVSVVLAGSRLIVTDNTKATDKNLVIEDVKGHAARDLGIVGDTDKTKIDGRQILRVDSLADVVAAINYGDGNAVNGGKFVIEASIDASGTRLSIKDNGKGSFPVTILATKDGSKSKALYDLGFTPGDYDPNAGPIVGQRIISGMDTVLLKTLSGGQGVAGGVIHIEANGANADVDLKSAETLRDAVERINAAAKQFNLGIEAGYDATGTRLLITNAKNPNDPIKISDVEGKFAEATGIAGSGARLRGADLERRYISETTRLADLNNGKGAALGSFKITNSKGVYKTVNLVEAGAKTLGDVIDAINDLKIDVEARINDTGDGLVLIDKAGGKLAPKVSEDGGVTARDLNLLNTAVDGKIDGSYEFAVKIEKGDGLTEVVNRINKTTLATAKVINDGSVQAPYRLSVASRATGRAGELVFDAEGTDLDLSTLTRAQDARVLLGDSVEGGILVTSSSNTLTNVVEGLTINLTSVDDKPVTVTVDRDYERMLSTMKGLVDDYNAVMGRIDELSSYNPDTETAGILLGDSALNTVESRLLRSFASAVPGAKGTLKRLSQLGVKLADGRLSLDEEKFREVYDADPEEVTRFFTAAETGLAPQLKETLKRLTESDGVLKRRDDALGDQKKMLGDRVTQLNELLDRKRQRMLREFQAMEQALAQLQAQQSVLTNFASLFPSGGT